MGNRRNPIYDKAWKLYQDGMSLAQVAEAIGVTRQSVFCAFRMRRYQLRSPEAKPFIQILDKKFTVRRDGHWRCTTAGRITAQKFVWEYLHGKVPQGYCVVHIDRNPANNHPNNLECVPRSQSGKYAIRNNGFCKGRKQNPMVNKFCLNCGSRIRGPNPAYIKARSFCSPRCLGEYRKGTRKGLTAAEINRDKTINQAKRLIY